ncbi:MAG: Na/Pi symporter, partial [Halanaerobiales bacterium]
MLFFISGLLLFLLGLEGSKKAIKYAVSDNIEKIIKNITNSIFLSLLIGIIITALIQSSSAVSILAISLIEAGILSLRSAIALIMGANIGTTITVQIISLPIISNYPVIIILALIIISIAFLFKNEKIFFSGLAILSFGIVFMGLNIMITYFQKPEITIIIKNILFYSRNSNILGVILGMVVTAIIQSSSAVTAITIGLAYNNLITLHSAVAIALGSNIGTCITAYIASF